MKETFMEKVSELKILLQHLARMGSENINNSQTLSIFALKACKVYRKKISLMMNFAHLSMTLSKFLIHKNASDATQSSASSATFHGGCLLLSHGGDKSYRFVIMLEILVYGHLPLETSRESY
ncbi:CLUMA_CG014555, isoform A [Clunio marinus]|uniref:CLUMA_CG014555, isoform A n=1 Tax=Clunio marinus TaxID=568069 RepID=A0A1J1IR57_9DIPT|nr:CLUMA_CG014555, isoform A [Clunio marinus]